MADPTGAEAVRDALEGIEAAFTAAARRRAAIVRAVATAVPPPALAPAHRALAEALVRVEAADADRGAPPRDRAERVLAEQRRADAARARLAAAAGAGDAAYLRAVDEHVAAADATWTWALERAEELAAGLSGRATPAVADAVAAYVGAFAAVLAAGRARDAPALAAAVDRAEAAGAALERVLAI